MRRKLNLLVDQLEGKALMTGFVAPIHAPASPGVPAGVVTAVTVSSSTIATSGSVTLSLTETNTTSKAVSFAVPVSKEGFEVFERGIEVWTSNPHPASQSIQLVTLAPGQTLTLASATWNDTSNVHALTATGTFTVANELDASAPTPTVTVTGVSGSTPITTPTSPSYPRNPPKLHTVFG